MNRFLFESDGQPRAIVWGSLTAAWLVGLLLVYPVVTWRNFIAMDPNEFGDFLAGVAGPPAMMWLVLGFFQQKVELRNQIVEMQRSVAEFEEQTRLQREALEGERIQHTRADLERRIAELPTRLLYVMEPLAKSFRVVMPRGGSIHGGLLDINTLAEHIQRKEFEAAYGLAAASAKRKLASPDDDWPGAWAQQYSSEFLEFHARLRYFAKDISEIIELGVSCREDALMRLRRLGAYDAMEALEALARRAMPKLGAN